MAYPGYPPWIGSVKDAFFPVAFLSVAIPSEDTPWPSLGQAHCPPLASFAPRTQPWTAASPILLPWSSAVCYGPAPCPSTEYLFPATPVFDSPTPQIPPKRPRRGSLVGQVQKGSPRLGKTHADGPGRLVPVAHRAQKVGVTFLTLDLKNWYLGGFAPIRAHRNGREEG